MSNYISDYSNLSTIPHIIYIKKAFLLISVFFYISIDYIKSL